MRNSDRWRRHQFFSSRVQPIKSWQRQIGLFCFGGILIGLGFAGFAQTDRSDLPLPAEIENEAQKNF